MATKSVGVGEFGGRSLIKNCVVRDGRGGYIDRQTDGQSHLQRSFAPTKTYYQTQQIESEELLKTIHRNGHSDTVSYLKKQVLTL